MAICMGMELLVAFFFFASRPSFLFRRIGMAYIGDGLPRRQLKKVINANTNNKFKCRIYIREKYKSMQQFPTLTCGSAHTHPGSPPTIGVAPGRTAHAAH